MSIAVAEREVLVHSILGDRAANKSLQPGESLFWQGDFPTAVYQVLEGFVKLTWTSPCGRETISELLLPGDVLDLPSCLDGSPYPFTCKAPSNSTARLAVVSRGVLLEDPEMARRCQLRMVQQLRRQRSSRVASPAERVEVRLSRALLWLAESLGEKVGQRVSFQLQLTRQELAEWIGTTTETVIRLCSDWKRRSLIEWDRHFLTLINVQQLGFLGDAA
ncbi:MAG: Crp/Fnr family transcriptional regulator [Candidatus Eremiobacteraeota bacterium]|nr:Crp/Fnr family transcriptional regulator [Candidatus Eremiobacteraeota bacterium]MCW5871199.1 Crp/Fnr family transcriptional regulator [Candidatus Eremiobacteraeota bacterium]